MSPRAVLSMSPLCPLRVTKCRWAFAAVQVGPRNLVAAHVAAPPPPRCQVLTGVCCRASGTYKGLVSRTRLHRHRWEGLARVRYATRAVPVRVSFLFIIQPSLPSITQKKTSRHDNKEKVFGHTSK